MRAQALVGPYDKAPVVSLMHELSGMFVMVLGTAMAQEPPGNTAQRRGRQSVGAGAPASGLEEAVVSFSRDGVGTTHCAGPHCCPWVHG